MGKVLGPDGITVGKRAINMKQAQMTHKVVMIYLKHNFGDRCELCDCEGCSDVRERLGGDIQ